MNDDFSYDAILARMLARVDDQIDKREGSIIYDALAPAAMELMYVYLELENVLDETFADTASRDNLIRRAAERGIYPTPASYAIVKGVFNINVSLGDRFSCGDLMFKTLAKITDCEFTLECETIGAVGNLTFGDLVPVYYIDGLETAQISGLLIPGEDEESTEVFRTRYFATFDSQAFGGNQADYIERTNAIAGVGGCKVYPAWNGGGTVKLVIVNSEYGVPTDTLIDEVQETVDPTENTGEGLGFAPIGHKVTVAGVEGTEIDISATFTFVQGYTFANSVADITDTVNTYFKELIQGWENDDAIIVRVSQIETRILGLVQVLDIEDTTINSSTRNIVLEGDEIPVLGDVTNG